MAIPGTDVTARLAAFGSRLTVEALPGPVVSRVKLLLLDSLASAATGWSSPETRLVLDMAERVFGEGAASIIGGDRSAIGAVVMANGYLITARSFCDVHQPTLCHVTPVAVPPSLALAEREGVPGSTLLAALAVAFEATVRIGLALDYPIFRSKGWHSPGVAGAIGSSLGAARVLGLDAVMAERTMGLAAAQAGGTFASFGTPAIKFHQARAAVAALLAAELSNSGFLGPRSVLEAEDGGVLTTFSDGGRPERAVDRLTEDWLLEEITVRLWPAAVALQPILTIVYEEHIPAADEIEQVEIGLPPSNYRMNANMGWSTTFEAALSARYVAAVALLRRGLWLDDLEGERLAAPGTAELAGRITVVESTSLPEGGASMRLRLRSGEDLEFSRDHPRGSPKHPATWEDVSAKARQSMAPILGGDRTEAVIDAVASLEELESVAGLTDLLRR